MVFILACTLTLTGLFVALVAALYALITSRKAHMCAQNAHRDAARYSEMLASWERHSAECVQLDQAVRQVEVRKGLRAATGTRLGHAVKL